MRLGVNILRRVFWTVLNVHVIELIIGLFLHYLAVVDSLIRGLEFWGKQLREEISVGGHGRLKEFQLVMLPAGGEIEALREGRELAEGRILVV